MKSNLFAGIVGGFACTFLSLHLNAQTEAKPASSQISASVFNVGNFVDANTAKPAGVPVDASAISNRIQKTFGRTFGERSSVSWSQLGKNVYLAQFDMDGRKTNALFHNNGYMEYSVSYGGEKNIPAEVRRNLRSFYGYSDFNVGATFEIKYKDRETWRDATAWVVNLQDDHNLVIARVMNDNVDELARLQTNPQTRVRKGKVIIPKQ